MILILKCIYSSFIIQQSGELLTKILKINNSNFYEKSLLGLIFLAFLALSFNFFLSVNYILNTFIFISLTIFFFFNKNFDFKKILFSGLLTSIILYLAKTNNPDGGLYHLPYTQILNEHKLIIGINNLHFRFGLASMLQYVNAPFNNFFLGVEGITIPVALLSSYLLFYLFEEIKNNFYVTNEVNFFLLLISTILLITSFYSFNRYSNYGNDSIVHILYIITIINFIKFYLNPDKTNLLYLILIYSFFLVINKITFSSIVLICFLSFIISKKKNIFSRTYIFLYVFIILWLLKNFLVSGCLIFPISFTCFDNFIWTNIELANQERLAGEAWSKGWPSQKTYSTYSDFISDFNWLNVWLKSHFFVIIEKFLPIIIFVILFFLPFMFIGKSFDAKNSRLKSLINILLVFSSLNIVIWFNFFPIYRYGYSFLLIFFIILSFRIFFKILKLPNFNFLKKYLFSTILIVFFFFLLKNTNRIIENIAVEYSGKPFPNIKYSYYINKNPKIEEKNINNKFKYFYTPDLCFYNESPCTNYKIENLGHVRKYGFNILYIKK